MTPLKAPGPQRAPLVLHCRPAGPIIRESTNRVLPLGLTWRLPIAVADPSEGWCERLGCCPPPWGFGCRNGRPRSGPEHPRTSDVHGLYISIPFCKFKCTYCNFASGVFPRVQLEGYLHALE